MTDYEFQLQKSRVMRYIKKWQPAGFSWWRITYVWSREEKPESTNTAADCSVFWEYRSAKITFYLPVIADTKEEDELERIVVHEHVHILNGSTQNFESDEAREMTEYACENVTRALLWTHQFVKKEVKL